MPESVPDRLNCRHELIFLLVKSTRYWFDLDPIRIPHADRASRLHRTIDLITAGHNHAADDIAALLS